MASCCATWSDSQEKSEATLAQEQTTHKEALDGIRRAAMLDTMKVCALGWLFC